MKKRILSILLMSAMVLNMSGCLIAEKIPINTTATTTATTTTTTTTAATTTTTAVETESVPDETDNEVQRLIDLINNNASTTAKPAETTKPVVTTTNKPTETTKPVDTDIAEGKLGSFTGEPEIDWNGNKLELEINSVSGATEYYLSIDSKGFTDNGNLYNEKILPKTGSSTVKLNTKYDFSLPRYVYVSITATNGKESTVREIKYDTFRGSVYGNAGCIDGRTVIVTVFANDPTTKWTDSAADKQTMDETWESMRCATEWLTKSAAKYGANAEFIWDWKKDSELKYVSSFDRELDTDILDRSYKFNEGEENKKGLEYLMIDTAIKDNIRDIEYDRFLNQQSDLLEKYDADNIIYFHIVNTTPENGTNSFSVDAENYNLIEYVVVYAKEHKVTARANTYAHEILHLFGTPDLYCENDTIPQAYVDYLDANGCNSIMYYGQSKDDITREFTDLEAYYTGLINYHEDVKKWGLGESDFFRS